MKAYKKTKRRKFSKSWMASTSLLVVIAVWQFALEFVFDWAGVFNSRTMLLSTVSFAYIRSDLPGFCIIWTELLSQLVSC